VRSADTAAHVLRDQKLLQEIKRDTVTALYVGLSKAFAPVTRVVIVVSTVFAVAVWATPYTIVEFYFLSAAHPAVP
jgi:hypothetical protein